VLLIRLLAKAPVGLQVSNHIVKPGDMVTCLSTWFRGYRIETATTMSLPAAGLGFYSDAGISGAWNRGQAIRSPLGVHALNFRRLASLSSSADRR
jgi:hypothetical protein